MRAIRLAVSIIASLLTSSLAGCFTTNKIVVGSVPPGGVPAPGDYEVLGQSSGAAWSGQFLLLSGGACDGGFLVADGGEPLVRPHWIGNGLVDAVIDYVFGSEHLIETARREALFQALEAFPEADTLLFPRYEVESSELLLVPGLASGVDVRVTGMAVRWKRPAAPNGPTK